MQLVHYKKSVKNESMTSNKQDDFRIKLRDEDIKEKH